MYKTFNVNADRALEIPDEETDILERAPLAKQVSEAIFRYNSADSLTIGIIGSWGSGKSTILNFIKFYARDQTFLSIQGATDETKPLVIEFNPWWFVGREDLFKQFFIELKTQIQKEIDTNGITKIEKAKRMAKKLTHITSKLASIGTSIPEPVVKSMSGVIKAITDSIFSSNGITVLKISVSDAIKKLSRPIWIFVEDLDRLDAPEAKQVISLIRSVADMPNTRYFIAFDNSILTELTQGFHETRLKLATHLDTP